MGIYDGTEYWDTKNGWFAWVKKARNMARNYTVTLTEPAVLDLGRRSMTGGALDVWMDFHDKVKTIEELGPYMMALMGEPPLVDTLQKIINLRFKGDLPAHEAEFQRYMLTITPEQLSLDRLAAILYGLSFGDSQEGIWKMVGDATKSFKATRAAARLAKAELGQKYRASLEKAVLESAARRKRRQDSRSEYGSAARSDYKRRHPTDNDTKSPANNTPVGPPRCFNCNCTGHFANECPEVKN